MPFYLDSTMIIFAVALLGIVGMLFLKYLEVKSGNKSILSRLGQGTDHIVHIAYDKVKFFVSHFNSHTMIALAQWIAVHVLSWLRGAYILVYRLAHRNPHSKKVIDMVRGKGEADRNGGSSFFLKQISENRNSSVGVNTSSETSLNRAPEPVSTVAEGEKK